MSPNVFSCLRVRLIGLLALATLPALAMILYSDSRQRRAAEKETQEELRQLVHAVTDDLQGLSDRMRDVLLAMTMMPDIRSPDVGASSTLLADLMRAYPHVANFGVIRPDGSVVASGHPLPSDVNLADRPYFRRAVDSRSFSVGTFQVGRITRMRSINFACPVLGSAGEVLSVVFAAVNLDLLDTCLASLPMPGSMRVWIVDGEGTVLATHPSQPDRIGKAVDTVLRGIDRAAASDGLNVVTGEDGESWLYDSRRVMGVTGDLRTLVGLPRSIAMGPVRRQLAFNLSMLALVSMVGLAAVWFGGDLLILRRVRALNQAADRLMAGDLSVRVEARGADELGRLGAAINAMAETLHRKQAEDQAVREELQARIDLQQAVAAISTHFVCLDAEGIGGGIQNTLQAVGTLTGADRAALILMREKQPPDIAYEWCGSGVEPRKGRLERQPLAIFPAFAERIARLEPVHVPRVKGLPEGSPERLALEAEGVSSFLVLPVHYGRSLLGLLAIEASAEERHWSDDAVGFLRIVTEIIAGALERRRVERELRRSEERYRYVFERSIQGILIHQDDVIRYVNPALLRLLGYARPEELVGRSIWESMVAPEERASLRDRSLRALRGETVPVHYGWQAVRQDGSRIWVQSTVSLVTWEHRPAVCAFLLDVTDRKLVEEALRQQQREQQVIFDSVPAMIWYKDANNRILRVNRTAAQARGLTPREMEGRPMEAFYPVEAARSLEDDREVIRTGKPKLGIMEYLTISDREQIIVRTDKVPYRDDQGRIIGVIVISVDITERVRAEEAQRERTEQMLRQQAALLRLGRADPADYEAVLLQITEEASQVLGVRRVGVWRYTEDRGELVCEDAYDAGDRRHARGAHRSVRECPRHLQVLTTHRVIATPDIRSAAAAAEIPLTLASEGTVSMLIAAVMLGGRVVGLVCCEHVGPSRAWSTEDQNFAASLADFVTLALSASERKRSEDRLRTSEALYQSLVENIPLYIIRKDRSERITFCNQRYCELVGRPLPQLLGTTGRDLYPEPLAEKYHRDDRRVLDTGEMIDQVEANTLPNGETIYVHVIKTPIRDAAGRITGIQILFWDVTLQRRTEEALASERNLLHILMDNSPDMIYFKDTQSRFLRVNRAWALRAGLHDPADAIGKTDFDFYGKEHAQQAYEDEQAVIRTGQPLIGKEEREIWPDGTETWASTTKIPYRDPDGRIIGTFGISRDITAGKRAEQELFRRAFYDSLTNLPNRSLFLDRLSHALRRARRRDHFFAVLFLDLDRFKNINDSLGHLAGDRFLVAIARRLETCLRPGDTVARHGGDEFVILLEEIKDVAGATAVADRILKTLCLPCTIQGQEVCTSASIGIAPFSPAYDSPEDLLRDADTAMYRAKEAGRARHVVFDESMHAHVVRRLQLENDLRRAVDQQEFLLHYQPIVSLATGRITGVEALLRWRRPSHPLLTPGDFMAAAEESGLIVPIGLWVLRESCRQARVWQSRFPAKPPLSISVNVSPRQFIAGDLLAQIGQILDETGLDPNTLTLEVTESVLMEQVASSSTLLSQMKALRVQLNLDDFGTGYSSLGYLQRYPVSVLKIHHSFVGRLDGTAASEELVRTILTLARNLRMQAVAEGVETETQLKALRAMGCDMAQGYYLAPPVDADGITRLLESGKTW